MTSPQHISSYPINQEVAKREGLRKYGFTGSAITLDSYILRTFSRHLAKPISETSLDVLQLGSGTSACAVRNGRSHDTCMGLTPVSGLPGATRTGTTNVGVTEAEDSRQEIRLASSSDFGEIIRKKDKDEGVRLAYDIFEDQILDMVGACWLKLGGRVDALVFAGGIGEQGKELRESVVERCTRLGFAVDKARNEVVDAQNGDVAEIRKDD